MKGHEEIERILASYRDAPAEERGRADAHLKACPQCAARFALFCEVDANLARLAQPALPAGLVGPLAALAGRSNRAPKAARQSPGAAGFALRGLAPAGLILFVIAALSIVLLSVNDSRVPATLTPTLTLTLTPTTISTRQTEVAGVTQAPVGIAPGSESGPTPAPIPAPAAHPVAAHGPAARPPLRLVGYPAHAKITN